MICFVCFTEKINKTVKIEASTVDIEERGVKLRLTVVDTPGFGDAMNCHAWFVIDLLRTAKFAEIYIYLYIGKVLFTLASC